MSNHCVKVWCNSKERTEFTALVDSLKLNRSIYWDFDAPQEEANLWCLIDFGNEKDTLLHEFNRNTTKPEVICLAQRFEPPPDSEWTFFKTPINAIALHNWIKRKFSKHFQDTKKVATITPEESIFTEQIPSEQITSEQITSEQITFEHTVSFETATQPTFEYQWETELFRFKYWPNVTEYSNSPDMIHLCSVILKNWSHYSNLPEHNIPQDIVRQLLIDAEYDNNLIYMSSIIQEIPIAKPTTDDEVVAVIIKDESVGFFKGLLKKLLGSI